MAADPTVSSTGIWADVDINVTIQSHEDKTDRVDSIVTIRATNHTGVDLPLTEPYRLPVRKVFDAHAYAGEYCEKPKLEDVLLTQKEEDKVVVHFRNHILKAKSTFVWTVRYSRMAELYLAHILAFDLFIDPQDTFQGVAVKKHDFTFSVTVLVPSSASWKRLRHWNIHQQNTLHVNPTVTHEHNHTTCVYGKFVLGAGEAFDMRLAGVYEFKSWIGRAFHIAVGAAMVALLEHGPTLAYHIYELIRGNGH